MAASRCCKILSRASSDDRRGRGQPAHRAAPDRDRRGPLSRRSSSAKTAALFAAACRIAAVVAERDEAAEQALDAYGRNLGIAFQLVDDAIDYASDAGDDGQGRRRRFPRRQGHAAGHPRLCARLGERAGLLARRDGGRAQSATRISPRPPGCCATPARSTTRSPAPATTASARSMRSALPGGRAKAAMVEAVEFAVARAY